MSALKKNLNLKEKNLSLKMKIRKQKRLMHVIDKHMNPCATFPFFAFSSIMVVDKLKNEGKKYKNGDSK